MENATLDRDAILKQLHSICTSETFFKQQQEQDLLTHIVTNTLDRKLELLTQHIIGIDVFHKLYDWDYRDTVNTIVRKKASDLRKRLAIYYQSEGSNSPIDINIPKGAYVAKFVHRQPLAEPLKLKSASYVSNAITALDARTIRGDNHAIHNLDLALAIDPDHPRVLALKALTHLNRAFDGYYPPDEIANARALIDHVPDAPTCWEYVFVQACLQTCELRWQDAGDLFERAMSLSSGMAGGYGWYNAYLISQLRADEAIEILNSIMSDHQLGYNAALRTDLSVALLCAGRLDEAESCLREALDVLHLDSHYELYLILAFVREACDDFAGAVEAISKIQYSADTTMVMGFGPLFQGLNDDGRNGGRQSAKGSFDAMRKARESFDAKRETGESTVESTFVPAAQIGVAAIGAGMHEEAITWLIRAVKVERDPSMIWTNTLPFYRHLRSDPRFIELVTEILGLKFPD